ncbi:MAG: mechanosensitive ion channel [Mogibacterium sp.]|nr:mechanosensitive ion channel [Mogibacterium sp.]
MEASMPNWDKLADRLSEMATDIGIKVVLAIVIYIVGSFIIKKLVKAIGRMKSFRSVDTTAALFITNFVKIALYIVLAVSIVALLGVPMSSVIALIASAGVAIGLAMQGSLANIAGGIMLLIFRPFSVGDYISAGADEGTVRSINLFYTVLTTVDNRRICVPNGNLMNSSISNATVETLRRVDLSFDIASSEAADKVESTIMSALRSCEKILEKPEPQVLPLAIVTDGITYAVRVWVNTKDYWNVHTELLSKITAALNEAEISRPATPVKLSGDMQ